MVPKVLMADWSWRAVRDVRGGDQVMDRQLRGAIQWAFETTTASHCNTAHTIIVEHPLLLILNLHKNILIVQKAH